MSFADQFYAHRIARYTQAIQDAKLRHDGLEAETQRLALGLFTSLWKRTERILLAESADQMVADLLARIAPLALVRATASYSLPPPLWLELAQPLVPIFDKYTDYSQPAVKGVFWYSFFDARLAAAVTRFTPAAQVKGVTERAKVLAEKEQRWLLDLISPEQERIVSLAFDRESLAWDVSPIHLCPFALCTGSSAREVCPLCAHWRRFWSLRFPLMLMVKDQLFAQSRVVTETALRRVPRERSGKKRTIAVPSSYRVIDASTKTVREVRQALFPRGSWLARHEPDEIEYVEKLVRPFKRTYRSERYKNVRGQTVQFTPRQSRHIPTLKDRRRVTHAVRRPVSSPPGTPGRGSPYCSRAHRQTRAQTEHRTYRPTCDLQFRQAQTAVIPACSAARSFPADCRAGTRASATKSER